MSEVQILSPRFYPEHDSTLCDGLRAMSYPKIHLKSNRKASVANRHPWIFSGALQKSDTLIENGDIVSVCDHEGRVIATGAYSKQSMIAVRVFEFEDIEISRNWLTQRIQQAALRRQLLGYGPGTDTTGYRVVFGESDNLPGLVVDRYADMLVIQIATAGMEKLRDDIIAALTDIFKPSCIFERSDLPNRREEGLELKTGLCVGQMAEAVEFLEHGITYMADIAAGQKTGFYLDQKDLRREIRRLAYGRRALDLFSYTGACGIAALAGGGTSAHFVDSSESALALCRRQAVRNKIDISSLTCDESDVFQWLSVRSKPEYDLVMLDPPALIKSKRHFEAGSKAYHFLNRAALRLVNDGGLFATSSCSAFFPEAEMAAMLHRAAEQIDVELSLLKTVRQSPDHALSLTFPEAAYLKSFICQVRR